MANLALGKLTNPNLAMDRSKDKTIIRTPQRGNGGSGEGNALPNGYVLQGRYVIEAQLGSGGFGITYLAKHRYLEDLWVAIKEYLPEGAAIRDSTSRVHAISEQHNKIYAWGLHRFLDEARLLRQFKHPNIVSVEDFFEANNTAYLVMNYVRGRSIQADLDAGRKFDEAQLRRIVYPLLKALNLIHRDGLYHRDISPDNILLREQDDSPVLIDFGSARYEMRMHGPEQTGADRAHTPTTIFKQGYSPIEQYEGTTQGPYTDVYALGATLYRIALGARPVDALKRSGEIRLTKTDPLIPASEKGKDQYSAEFLRAIDAAMQLEPANRPQTTDAWLQILGPPEAAEETQPPSGTTAQRQPPWRILLIAGAITAAIGAGGYLWYDTRQIAQVVPTDVPTLLSHAGAELEKAPFDAKNQEAARLYFLRILNQDPENTRALAGYSAANILKQFNDVLAKEDRRNAVVLLDKAESELKRAGIKRKILEPGWQRVEVLNKLTAIRELIPRAPLAVENWSAFKQLLKDIEGLPGGAPLAESGRQGLQRLRLTLKLINEQQFAKAREQLSGAERLLSPLGVGNLPVAQSQIDAAEAKFQAERIAKITSLLQTAEAYLQEKPLTLDGLTRAAKTYNEILRLDDGQSKALAGRALSQKLLNAYDAIKNNDFESAQQSLDSGRKIATSAGIASGAVNQAGLHLAKTQHAWTIDRQRTATRKLLSEAVARLAQTPLDPVAIEQAQSLYKEARSLSADEVELGAEKAAASKGVALTDALAEIGRSLADRAFGQARQHLNAPQIRELSDAVGLGPPLTITADRRIADEEIAWNDRQAKQILQNRDLVQEANLAAAQSHLERILALQPERTATLALANAIEKLRAAAAERGNHDYEAASRSLDEAQTLLNTGGVSGDILATIHASIQTEADAWQMQQREQEIAASLGQAFDALTQQPFSVESWATSTRLFDAIAAIEGGHARAVSGKQILSELRQAHAAMNKASFGDALQRVNYAEQLLKDLDARNFDAARAAISKARENWNNERQQRITATLKSAQAVLRDQEFNEDTLAHVKRVLAEVSTLEKDQPQALAGVAMVSSLEEFLQALAANDFMKAEAYLSDAVEKARVADFDPDSLNKAKARLSGSRATWQVEQTEQSIAALIAKAKALINDAALNERNLQRADEAYRKAFNLNQSLAGIASHTEQVTAGMEAILLLKAFKAELADRQFKALKVTLTELHDRLKSADLDPAIAQRLTSSATDSEVVWRTAQASDFIRSGVWNRDRNFAPAEGHYAIVLRMRPDQPGVEPALKGIENLKQLLRAQDRRNYEQALILLDQALSNFSDADIPTEVFDELARQLQDEQQRWARLTQERDLISWTGAAVRELRRTPFSKQAWERTEDFTERILAVRNDDERGLAVQRALGFMRQAKQAKDEMKFANAKRSVEQAQAELVGIGLRRPFQNALAIIDSESRTYVSSQFASATTLLSQTQVLDEALYNARTALEKILEVDNQDPLALSSIAVLDNLIAARAASAATRYNEANEVLNQARATLVSAPTSADPLASLKNTEMRIRQSIADQRPDPGEIYPIISVALRTIADAPLKEEKLDAAERLLRNVLGLQADERTALVALQAIEHLRTTQVTLSSGRVDDAKAALQRAQEQLVGIGLAATTLQSAWQLINGSAVEAPE